MVLASTTFHRYSVQPSRWHEFSLCSLGLAVVLVCKLSRISSTAAKARCKVAQGRGMAESARRVTSVQGLENEQSLLPICSAYLGILCSIQYSCLPGCRWPVEASRNLGPVQRKE